MPTAVLAQPQECLEEAQGSLAQATKVKMHLVPEDNSLGLVLRCMVEAVSRRLSVKVADCHGHSVFMIHHLAITLNGVLPFASLAPSAYFWETG